MSTYGQTAGLLKQLMGKLMSSDNAERSQAEQALNNEWRDVQPQTLLGSLAFLVHRDASAEARAFASVLLRRIAFQPAGGLENKEDERTVWSSVPVDVHQAVRAELLGALGSESDQGARHKLCDTIAEIADNDDGDEWPELLPALYACAQNDSAALRESAYRVFAACAHLLEQQSPEAVSTGFVGAFQDSEAQVRVAALKAAVAFVVAAGTKQRAGVAGMVPQMLSVLEPQLRDGDEAGLTEALLALVEAAEAAPKLFRAVLGNVVSFAMEVGRREELESATRQAAVELVVTLAEAAPGMCRKHGQFCAALVPVCLQMLSSVEDDEAWHTTETLEEADNESDDVFGEQTLDRVANALGGKQLLPVAFGFIPQMLESDKWEQRHAALMAISSIGEGCYKLMHGELGRVVQMVVGRAQDAHARVRYAVCNCLGQMATDFAPQLQEEHHEAVVGVLVGLMGETSAPRVQTHAAAAMVNFAEEAPRAVLEPYLDALLARLLSMLGSPRRYVQEQAITTIATVADTAQTRFGAYYATIMPLLLDVLAQATDRDHRLLRGKAMECATFVALAVGRATVEHDLPRLVALLTQTQQAVTESDDPQAAYLQASWARLCKLMGADFAPLLPVVMPPLVAAARQQPDFAVLRADEDAEASYAAEDGWEFASIGGQQVGIRTTALEEKCDAVELLATYARDLGAAFVPYAADALDLLAPLFRFYFHEGVRYAAAAAVPLVLRAVQLAGDASALRGAWAPVCDKYISVLAAEDDDAFVLQLFSSFADAVDAVGSGALGDAQLAAFASACLQQMNKYYRRMHERQAARAAEEVDDDDEEQLAEEEALEGLAVDEVAKALHAVFRAHGSAFAPHFRALLPVAQQFLAERDPAARQWAICVFDDLVEFTGAASAQYAAGFLDPLAHALRDTTSPDLRQAAAYGVGVMAQFGGDAYAGFVVTTALPAMLDALARPDARTAENVFATENVVAALAKVLRAFGDRLPDARAVLRTWFAALPVCNDEDEVAAAYEYLVRVATEQPGALFDSGDTRALAHLVKVVVEPLAAFDLPADLARALVGLVSSSLAGLDDNARAALWAEIPAEQQQAVQAKGLL
ncbi:ARM repeat-containing protein [Coemansia reversa NRRL 1564]|uniref:ARM repeat-containing protein n=1 Tax=Coemansia reversa (strain ATCC 12441 / NRRL 1564) TaxID=763665 RepID=A0A2G5B2R8_COERN|nr:ARM repeat-containing protein [Coemansia reversa NRRL 1564]|eukprot:PIA13281.1 ARM repeat-containing protein [Coemansia reversa NRRL 1564]